MKAIKYFVVGALLSIAAPTVAQTTDYSAALSAISTALKSNTGNAEALVKDYKKVYKKNAEALVALGNSYLAVKNYAKANELADLALAAAKKDAKLQAEAYILKGDIEAVKDESGNGGGAASYYAQAKSIDPKNPQAYMRYASIYRKINPDLVEQTYAELLENIPGYPIHAEAGSSFFSANKWDKAFENYSKCDLGSLDEGNMVKYIVSAVQLRKFADAYTIAAKGLGKYPENLTLNQLGLWSAVESGKNSEAIGIAKKFLSMEGDRNATDYTYYGKALLATEQYEEAIAQFEKAVSIDSKATEPLGKISEAYTALGNEDKALEYSEQYMQKNPNAKPSDYAKLAQIYIAKADKGVDKAANIAKALSIYDQMAAKYPTTANYASLVAATTATKAGQKDVAAAYYEKIVANSWSKADRSEDDTDYLKQALKQLGYYNWVEKKNLDAAKPYYEKLIQLDPEDANAKRALGLE